MAVEVVTPDDYMGDVIATCRRAAAGSRAMDQRATARSSGPGTLADMFGYATDLRSRTQGRATYSMQFHAYNEVPESIAKEIIAGRRGSR